MPREPCMRPQPGLMAHRLSIDRRWRRAARTPTGDAAAPGCMRRIVVDKLVSKTANRTAAESVPALQLYWGRMHDASGCLIIESEFATILRDALALQARLLRGPLQQSHPSSFRNSRATARECLEEWPHTSCLEVNVTYADGSSMRCPSSLREYAGSSVTYAGKRHQWRKRHLSARPSIRYREPVMRADATRGPRSARCHLCHV